MTLVSSIYGRGPAVSQRSEGERNQANRASLWHDMGVVVIDPAEITDEWVRQAVINEANERYGRRKG